MKKYLGYAINSVFSLLGGDLISSYVFHITLHYDPLSLFMRYIVCFLTFWGISVFLNSINKPKKQKEIKVEYLAEVEKQSIPNTHYFKNDLPSIWSISQELTSLIDNSSFSHDEISQNLKSKLQEIREHYQQMSDDDVLKNIQLYSPENYLFLKQEVIKLFDSFKDELTSLSKLEKNKVDSFETFKTNFMSLMLERANMVNQKLNSIQKNEFELKAQEMMAQATASQNVLKAKL
jgi:hypothetical protein